MILSKPQSEPVLTNVATSGEFRIRNSAKAFSILSSGLYSNKIRAVIRELSCNAVDSHVAAGKGTVPVVVHLPSALEPYFSVTDVGLGLDHEQVSNIYTTYFESTKTESNDFIGALGLGSKSPFSYTDNFSLTVAKNGIQNIYSAFINEAGVPSVALMSTQAFDVPNGVEVKLSVTNAQDYSRFMEEANIVFKYFAVRPKITGVTGFNFSEPTYLEKNIVPGIHQRARVYRESSVAIMGNICYPINIPNASTVLGEEFANMLGNTLEIHFDNGALDFQPSREGLSYIPETIEAIKAKLELLAKALEKHVAKKVKKMPNLWDKIAYLEGQRGNSLFSLAAKMYLNSTKLPLVSTGNMQYSNYFDPLIFSIETLQTKYNLSISRFQLAGYNGRRVENVRDDAEYKDGKSVPSIYFPLHTHIHFVVQDTKTGASRRARLHYANRVDSKTHVTVTLLSPSDKTKPMDYEQFLKDCYDPQNVFKASELDEVPRKKAAARTSKNEPVGVLLHSFINTGGRFNRKTVSAWNSTTAHVDAASSAVLCYVELKHKTVDETTKFGIFYDLAVLLENCKDETLNVPIFGVRKSEIARIKDNPKWISLDKYLTKWFAAITDAQLDELALRVLDSEIKPTYNGTVAKELAVILATAATSPFSVFAAKYPKSSAPFCVTAFEKLAGTYRPDLNLRERVKKIKLEFAAVQTRYPIVKIPGLTAINAADLAQYISLMDKEFSTNKGTTK